VMILMVLYFSLRGGLTLANKSSTSIETPQDVQNGSEIIIKITVTHKGNNFLHYTNWLKVTVNQKEVARWEFSSGNRPEGEVFTRELKIKAKEDLEVTAEAHCNRHGSAGPTTIKILVKD
ncbi:MAG: desulfoferrodoxin family protein, partial [Thermodesulfobacteriota bacterium]